MITQETAELIWCCYREIATGNKLLKDMAAAKEEIEKWHDAKYAGTLKDKFGRERSMQLGIPSGEASHRLFSVSPIIAETIIRTHIADSQKRLVEAQERARLELNQTTPAEA